MLSVWILSLVAPPLPLQVGPGPIPGAAGRALPPRIEFRDLLTSLGTHSVVLGRRALVFAREADIGDQNLDGDAADEIAHIVDLATGQVTSLGLAADIWAFSSTLPPWAIDPRRTDWVLLFVSERDQGQRDLNGDGDALDEVFFHVDLASAAVRNSGLASNGLLPSAILEGSTAGLVVSEPAQGGSDLNGDGLLGTDLFTWDLASAGPPVGPALTTRALLAAHLSYFLFAVSELDAAADLNGDGDALDPSVLHAYDASTGTVVNTGLAAPQAWARGSHSVFVVDESAQGADLNLDGDRLDRVMHVFDLATGQLRNLRLAFNTPFEGGGHTDVHGAMDVVLDGDRVAFHVSEAQQGGTDLNGDGDASDRGVLFVYSFATDRALDVRLSAFDFGLSGDWLVASVSESEHGTDFDGDGLVGGWVTQIHDLVQGTTWNLGLRAPEASISSPEYQIRGEWIAFKAQVGTRYTVMVADAAHRRLVPSGLFNHADLEGSWLFNQGGSLSILASEGLTGRDLNGDGDTRDVVLQLFYPGSRTVLNTGASSFSLLSGYEQVIPFFTREWYDGVDLNGDGDALDTVLRSVQVSLR